MEMESIKEILESRKFREQEPFNRKIVAGKVSIATGERRAMRPEQSSQHQLTRKANESQKKNAA